jgi:hypothetical protein
LGQQLPGDDRAAEIAPGRVVIKDLSGLPDQQARAEALDQALGAADRGGQALICANEGVLRDTLPDVQSGAELLILLDDALRVGAAASGSVVVLNVNRQRPTADTLWNSLLDYLTRDELWTGCDGCPYADAGCPMRTNADALRNRGVRGALRTLVRLGSGEAVPTLREVLAILAWSIVGTHTCASVRSAVRDQDRAAFTAEHGYFSRVLGAGLTDEEIERSPLLAGMRRAGLGSVSDLQIDEWLRDTSGAPPAIRELAGASESAEPLSDTASLVESRSPLDRVRTTVGTMTFHGLGEMVSTSEDSVKVEAGLQALVESKDGAVSRLALWRQRVFFEGSDALGGHAQSCGRLLEFRFVPRLVDLAQTAAAGGDTLLSLTELVLGLNFLVTGFSSPNEGLVVPDPACLFARNPGSYRPARPSLVHSTIDRDRLAIRVPDRGLVEELVDVDHVEVELVVDGDDTLSLRIGPQMHEAILEAAAFRGPVGQGVAEMNDLRAFYGRLAEAEDEAGTLRVADPDAAPPALISVTLPHFPQPLRGEPPAAPELAASPLDYQDLRALEGRRLRVTTDSETLTGTLMGWGDNGLALTVRRAGRQDVLVIERGRIASVERATRRRRSPDA